MSTPPAGDASARALATPCGTPQATPTQVVVAFLEANRRNDVDGMLACLKPAHREKLRDRPDTLLKITAVSFSVGQETVNGDDAEVAVTIERHKPRGGTELQDRPMRLRRVDGIWYLR